MSSASTSLSKNVDLKPAAKIGITGLHLGKDLESDALQPYILGAFYIFTKHTSSNIFALNEIGEQVTIPGPSKNAINQMVNVLLASRTPATPVIAFIKRDLFLDLTYAQGFTYTPDKGWLGSSEDTFQYKNQMYPGLTPTFIPEIYYPCMNDAHLIFLAPTPLVEWNIINGHLLIQALEVAIQSTKNRPGLLSELSVLCLFIDESISAKLSAPLFSELSPISISPEESQRFIYYCLEQLKLTEHL